MSNIHHIVNLNAEEKRIFSEEEALKLASLLTYLTDSIKKEIKQIEYQIDYNKHNPEFVERKQAKISELIQKWTFKVKRLGAEPVNLSQIKIPTDQGYFYWEHVQVK